MILFADLFWLVIAIIVSQMIARIWRGTAGASASRPAGPRQPAAAGPQQSVHMERDPVCGTFVVPERSVSVDDGTGRVYFCSTACRDKYRARTA